MKSQLIFPWVSLNTQKSLWEAQDYIKAKFMQSTLPRKTKRGLIWNIMQKTNEQKLKKSVRAFMQEFQIEQNPLDFAKRQEFTEPGYLDFNFVLNVLVYPLLQEIQYGPPKGIFPSTKIYRSLEFSRILWCLQWWHKKVDKDSVGRFEEMLKKISQEEGFFLWGAVWNFCYQNSIPNPFTPILGDNWREDFPDKLMRNLFDSTFGEIIDLEF